jgi:hypothetical protein
MTNRSLAPLLLALLTPLAAAQLREPGTPASFRERLPAVVPTLVFPVPNAKALREANESGSGGRLEYGVELRVGRSLEDSGRWDTVASTGENVWRLELVSPGAFSLGVVFQSFDLPRGAQVFLYHPLRRDVLGAYGESAENPNGVLAVQPLRGDRVVIEYVEPPGTLDRPALLVGSVVHDYRDLFAAMAREENVLAATCLTDINCPIGSTHQDIKRAVIWMCGGGGCCSGSILNNTAEDGTPFMMTADHCGDMTNGVFVFAYERTGCATGTSSQSKTLSGAMKLASSIQGQYDAQLYRLNQAIPASYEPFFAGWSLATPTAGPTWGISHPGGSPKKIQVDWQPPLQLTTKWNVENDIGAVQPGSSGSPLFDRNERVIGTCSTGASGCQSFSNYGRFDKFYVAKNLAGFLDPLGWGLSGIDGFDPIHPYARPYNGAGTNPNVYTSTTEPRLGTTWTARIDTSSRPAATTTILYGFDEPAEGPLVTLGQSLVDTTSTKQFEHSSPVVAGVSTHSFALPSNVSLVGQVIYTQGLIVGGGMRATNAVKIVLNF